MKKSFVFVFITALALSCKTNDATPEVVCSPTIVGNNYVATKFTYDANGRVISGEVDDIPVKFEYTGDYITKMIFANADASRGVVIENDAQNRPWKAKKVYTSADFNFTSDFVLSYDANGRLSTMKVDFKGDFQLLMVNRFEYDSKGNVLKHFIKEDANPEFVWMELSGYDDKKNINKAVKLNPLVLFYEPLNVFEYQSENNFTVAKSRVKNSEYIGPVYSADVKYNYTAYNSNGYPTAGTQSFTTERTDYNDPTLTKTIKESGSTALKLDYFCK